MGSMSFLPRRGIGWVAVLALGVACVAGCRKSEQSAEGGGGGPHGVPVVVAEAIKRDVPVYIDEIGRAVASEVVAIQSQASGRITEIHFKDGADVKRDQPLFTIDPRPYRAAVAQAEASLAENVATLSLMKSEFQRVQGLLQSNAISREEFEQRQNGVSVSEAQVEAAKAAIETAKVNLDYCFIKSPIDGRAGQRMVDLGNLVTPQSGQTLLMITKLNPVYVDFTITEDRLPDVRKHMADHTLRTLVWTPEDTANNVAPHEGELTFLNNSVQQDTGTVKLRATLPNSDQHFWPNQFVNVRMVLYVTKDAVLVPQTAIQIGQQGPFVYIVESGAAQMRPVVTGQPQGDLVHIQSGLTGGEKVITAGQLLVQPGAPVMIAQPAAPQANGAPSTPSTQPTTAPTTSPN